MLFFFQAEDGIRDYKVTGVQTCALPISEERPQWYDDPGSELRGHPVAVEWDDAHRRVRLAIFRQYPLAAVVAIVDCQVDRLNLDLEHIAWLCTLHIHRARQDVPPGAAPIAGHLTDDFLERGVDAIVGYPGLRQPFGRIGQ